jgi:hypothetical protein
MSYVLNLAIFAVVCFIQNMAFTWSSRSRNSGDPSYHRKAAWASNGVYYLTNALLTIYLIKNNALWAIALQGLVYTITTAEGSVLMMKRLIAKETGKRAVPTFDDIEKLQKQVAELKAEMDVISPVVRKDVVMHNQLNSGIDFWMSTPSSGVKIVNAVRKYQDKLIAYGSQFEGGSQN